MMIIKELKLSHFGKFHHKDISLRPGVNIVYGGNEAGKTTIHRFLKAMFFGVERMRGKAAANDDYSRFQPWEDGRNYEGMLVFEHNGRNYRIYRNFYKEDMCFRVFDDDTGEKIDIGDGQIDRLIPGFTEANFRNTISVGQQESRVDERFATSLQSYVANMSMAKDESIDISKAEAFLNNEEKKIKKQMPTKQMENLKRDIEAITADDAAILRHRENVAQLEVREQEVLEKIESYRQKIGDVRTHERKERMEGMRYIEQMHVVAQALKEEEDEVERDRGPGVLQQWSFWLFLILAAAAVVFMAVQYFMEIDRILYKMPAGILLACAVISFKKTTFRKSPEEIDFEAYEMEIEALKKKANVYIRKYGPKMTGPGQAEQIEAAVENLMEQKAAIIQRKEKLQWEIEHLEEEKARADELRAVYEEMAQENRKLRKEWEAIAVAKMVIRDLAGEIHQQFGSQLNTQVAEIFSKIADNEGKKVVIDEKLNVRIDGTKQLIPLNRMSTASIDQIYFALRFCAGELIFEDQQMPLIVDDCFAYYDDLRLQRILSWLMAQNKAQVILFTCHHREADMLDELGYDYNYIEL